MATTWSGKFQPVWNHTVFISFQWSLLLGPPSSPSAHYECARVLDINNNNNISRDWATVMALMLASASGENWLSITTKYVSMAMEKFVLCTE